MLSDLLKIVEDDEPRRFPPAEKKHWRYFGDAKVVSYVEFRAKRLLKETQK